MLGKAPARGKRLRWQTAYSDPIPNCEAAVNKDSISLWSETPRMVRDELEIVASIFAEAVGHISERESETELAAVLLRPTCRIRLPLVLQQ